MDFALSEEQRLLRDSAERFVRENYPFEKRRAMAASEEGFSREHWRQMAELGWLMLPFPEDDGGLGGGAAEVMLLMEAFGRGLVLEPYLSSILLAGRLLAALGDAAQRAAHLPALMEGRSLAALAFAEPQGRYDLAAVTTRAARNGDGWRLDGRKSVVLGGAAADLFLVTARVDGEADLAAFLLPADAAGLLVQGYPTSDGGRAAELELANVQLEARARLSAAPVRAALEAVIDGATAAICAEAVGIMEAATAATREYLRTRRQFGRPLAAFQVLQHRLADMVVACEEMRSLTIAANLAVDGDDAAERARAVSAAKAELGRRGTYVVAQAVQLHGGMGVSDELDIASHFKRLHVLNALFGDRDHHLRRYAARAA
ncbi:MAG: acyl-CoA dehydrogenase family protein [Rhodothalassiaceae bacterium]